MPARNAPPNEHAELEQAWVVFTLGRAVRVLPLAGGLGAPACASSFAEGFVKRVCLLGPPFGEGTDVGECDTPVFVEDELEAAEDALGLPSAWR